MADEIRADVWTARPAVSAVNESAEGQEVTDTPPIQPVNRLERIKVFIGDLARPFAIISTSLAASWASIVTAYRVSDGSDAAVLMGAIFAGVSALYLGKAWEVAKVAKSDAEVKIAETKQ